MTQRGDAEQFLTTLGYAPTYSGKRVTPETALSIAAVYAAVRIISESVAGLPFKVFEKLEDGKGRREATDHPIYRLIHRQANQEHTAHGMKISMNANALVRGNGYSEKIVKNGTTVELIPRMAETVTIERATPQSVVQYRIADGPFKSVGRTVPFERMFHIPFFSLDGFIGRSVLDYGRQSIGTALALEHHAAAMMKNGGRPGGLILSDTKMSPEAQKNLLDSWNSGHGGPGNAGATGILQQGLKYQQITLPPEDLQLLESRQFSIQEIARLFRVPLHMLAMDMKQPRANMEQSGIEFIVQTLGNSIAANEQSGNRDLFHNFEKDRYFVEMNVDGLLRGDSKARAEAFSAGRNDGYLSVNDIRRMMNLNPIEGGDEYLRPLNMTAVGSDADPEALPDPKDDSKAKASFREFALLSSAAERVVRKEAAKLNQLAKNCKDKEEFEGKAAEFYGTHQAFTKSALCVSETFSSVHCRIQLEKAVLAYEGGAVEKLTHAWKRDLPGELVEEALKDA